MEVFHHYGFHLSSSFLMKRFVLLRKIINFVVFPFPFPIFMLLFCPS